MKDLTLSYVETMLEHMPAGMALFEAGTLRLLAANLNFYALLHPDWQQGRAIGHSLTEFMPQTKQSSTISIFHRAAETGIAFQSEASTAFSFDQAYWDWSVEPINNADGQVIHLLLTLIETTAQVLAQQQLKTRFKQTDRALEMAQQRLTLLEAMTNRINPVQQAEDIARAALDAINEFLQPISVAFYATDSARQSFRALALALPPAKKSWKSTLTRIPYDRSSLLYQMLQKRSGLLRKAPGGSRKGTEELLYSIPGVNSIFWLPLWYDESCEGALAVAFAQEIHAKASQIQALEGCANLLAKTLSQARFHATVEQERQRLHSMLSQLPEGILLVESAGGTISYANAAASSLLGMPHQSLLGIPLHQLGSHSVEIKSSQSSSVPWNFALIHALGGKTIRGQELVVRRPDGSEAILLSSAAPISTDTGIITEAIVVFQDITVQKTIEQQKSTFLTLVNHELRTPLTAVLGFSDLLREHGIEGLEPMQAYAIKSIVEQSESLKYLVDEILDNSSFEQNAFTLNTIYQDLLPLLRQAVESCAQANKSYQIRLKLDILPTTARLMGWFDEQRIAQILNNLLTNATKYSYESGLIELGVKQLKENEEVLLWVKDQGMGIAPGDLPHIFEQFYRGQKRDRVVSGLGLGLYLVKELVQRHGGRIWAESIEGVESTFFLVLPLKRA